MPEPDSRMLMKDSDQVVFFLISMTTFMWIAMELTGSYLYR